VRTAVVGLTASIVKRPMRAAMCDCQPDGLDSAHRPWNHVSQAMAPLIAIPRAVLVGSLVGGYLPAQAVLAAPAGMAAGPTCRELERRLDLVRPEANSTGLNLVLFAAVDAGCVPLTRRLLDAGASLVARDRLGAMALARAARAGHVALVELFLAQGAPIDARNLVGATALYAAAENERQTTVAVLLARHADPNLPGPSGVTPLAAAAFKGNGRIVDQLITNGADPNVMDTTGKAAMTYAAGRGFALIVRRLLEAGVDPTRAYGNDLTALMWAAGSEEGVGARAAMDVVEMLLSAGAPVDAIDNRGRTALMIAAELGHAEIVDLLLGRGADRSIADKSGKRARDLAANQSIREKLEAN
jgi:ankyrin repeat protein